METYFTLNIADGSTGTVKIGRSGTIRRLKISYYPCTKPDDGAYIWMAIVPRDMSAIGGNPAYPTKWHFVKVWYLAGAAYLAMENNKIVEECYITVLNDDKLMILNNSNGILYVWGTLDIVESRIARDELFINRMNTKN